MLDDLRRAVWDEDGAQPRAWMRPMLWPAALAYRGAVAGWSRWGTALQGGVRRLTVPVVSVGNLVVGGAGKTPFSLWIAEFLIDRGKRPVLLARGYGGHAGRGPLTVSNGEKVLCGPNDAGDEPALIARRIRSLRVVVGSDRYRCGLYAVSELGADCAILDDGFQHRALHRDLNILLLDSSRPFGNGRLFPMGPLREPPAALSRADLVVFTRWDERENGASGRSGIVKLLADQPVVKTSHKFSGLYSLDGRRALEWDRLTGAAAMLVTGIANPSSFYRTAARAGFDVRGHLRFPDHHNFTFGEIKSVERKARACGAQVILTTEKDAVRFPHGTDTLDIPGFQVRVEIHVEAGQDALKGALEALLARGQTASAGD